MRALLQIIFVMGVLTVISSCSPCRQQFCDNGGYCQDGECFCEKWYSGEQCQLQFNRHYEGLYIGRIDSASRSIQSELEIDADQNYPNRLNVETGVYLEFENDSQLVIPTQLIVHFNDTIAVSGEGTYQNDILTFQYTQEYNASRGHLFQFTGQRYDLDIE